MAASVGGFLKLVLFCLLFFCTAVTSNENTTSYNLDTTVFDDRNATFDAGENYTTIQPTQLDSSTQTSTPSSTEETDPPALPPEPLPVSGRLLTPVTNVRRLCPCDQHKGVCDINCCCDTECGEEASLFTSCSVETVSENQQMCSHDVASYSLQTRIDGFSEIQSSSRKETNYDVLCIQSQNRVDGFSHPSPALPTDRNFDSLFKKFTSLVFGSEESSEDSLASELQTPSGYQYGDVMMTAAQNGQRGMFMLPTSGVTADCVDSNPAVFLKDQSTRCSRKLVLDQDCSGLPALSMETYTNIQLLSEKSGDAVVVSVELASVVLQSVDGTQSELQINGDENFSPVLLNPTLCANTVLKVFYQIRYSPAGEIMNVTLSLVLGFVKAAALNLEQEFHITFVQDGQEEAVFPSSGNPGYVFGLPVVSGTKTVDGIVRSIDPRDTLSLLHSTQDQDCLRGRHQRSPILFGLESVSGCTLRLEDAVNCSQVHQVLLNVLRGPNYPQYVASFGNSELGSPLDWVPIKTDLNLGEAQSCSIPLSLHLEIQWTKYGSLLNPQAQIVSVNLIIQTNTSSLALLSRGSSILPISTSVSFTPVSAPALPGYRATPTFNAKLPFDFFYPFV